MKEKVNDAYFAYRKQRHENNIIWKECKAHISGETRIKYMECWKIFIEGYKHKIRREGNKKVDWLVMKWKNKANVIPNEYQGVRITTGDGDLPQEFSSEPRIYGNVTVSMEERAALTLSPKFGLYENISSTRSNIQVEEAINKLRWCTIEEKVAMET